MPEGRRQWTGRLAGFAYWPAKSVQFLLFLAALTALLYGLYENGASVYYLARAVAVTGRVVNVETIGAARGRGDALRFPTIEYRWPPASRDSRWIASVVPRDDLRTGDQVLVRVLPSTPDLARQEMPLWWHVLAFALLLGGLVGVRQVAGSWYRLDVAFGRRPVAQAASACHIFQGPAGRRIALGVGLPVLLLGGFYLYFVPYLKPSELGHLWTRPGRLLVLAGERGGPPTEAPLNRHERRLLALPGLGAAAARDAFEHALRQGDAAQLGRYIAAIADPAIAFSVDLERLASLLMARQTEILVRLLDTGIEVPLPAKREMLSIAERQRSDAKLRVLAAHGIKRPEVAP
jgi:multisubunit Na+/H+ antiporter MnhB subunit